MKRISLALGFFAILFTLVSCQKEQSGIIATISRYQGGEKVYIDNDNQDTDDHYACWHSDDAVWIHYTTAQVSGSETTYVDNVGNYSLQSISGDDSHAQINMSSVPVTGTVLNAFYPSSLLPENATVSSDNTITINLPAQQTYTEKNGKQVINAPMVERTTINANGGANVEFHNVCALLKVRLRPNVFVYTITVTSDNAPLAGPATVSFGNDQVDPSLTMTNGEGSSVTVTLNVNACRADGIYYIVLPPYTSSSKLTVTVYDNPETLMTMSQQNSHSLGAGTIGVVNVGAGDIGRGLFSVDANHTTLVSFAPGNLTGTGPYSFTQNQTDVGTVYDYDANINSTYSNAMGSEWFLLSAEQWAYLLNREDASGNKLQARCSVNGQHGLMLFPDDWSTANGYPDLVTDNPWRNVTNWETLRNYGAVFLPSQPGNNDNKKHYLTATPNTVVIFGQGNGLPNGGRGIVATTDRSMASTNPPIEFNSGVTIPNGCIRLAHMVQEGTSASK